MVTGWMGLSPILPEIRSVLIDTMLNNNGLNISDGLNFVMCKQPLVLKLFFPERLPSRWFFDTRKKQCYWVNDSFESLYRSIKYGQGCQRSKRLLFATLKNYEFDLQGGHDFKRSFAYISLSIRFNLSHTHCWHLNRRQILVLEEERNSVYRMHWEVPCLLLCHKPQMCVHRDEVQNHVFVKRDLCLKVYLHVTFFARVRYHHYRKH